MLEPALFIAYKFSRGKREDCRVFLASNSFPFFCSGISVLSLTSSEFLPSSSFCHQRITAYSIFTFDGS